MDFRVKMGITFKMKPKIVFKTMNLIYPGNFGV